MTSPAGITIDKETINRLPIESFAGRIHVIESVDAAKQAIEKLHNHTLLGLDTETKPSFRKGRTNKVSLVQLSTDTDCYLFRINKIGFIDELRNLMIDRSITKIGLSLHDDFKVLHKIDDFEPHNYIDLQNIVKQYGIQDMSLQKIYAIVFGKKISKSQRLSNWEAPTLSVPQQYYAALDAWACLRIYQTLLEGAPFYYTAPVEDGENINNVI
ncbi:MAG: 3'-5' exonuclease domain-containing protein 2 [Bacteroidaceae bacterium]|nr:3'-5' exonuclease domain-containing protein 2 [Bacteroidaceae bacterium]